jgi:hypothetical protein
VSLPAVRYRPADPPSVRDASGRRIGLRELSWLAPLGLFVATLALYLATRSISLDDYDSFNFARAIDRFDLRLNQPQPPGYPVYVFLARLFDLLVHDHQAALLLLSAVAGAVTVLAFYGLALDLGAPLAALPLALMPLFWLSADMALSDMAGLAAATAAVFVLNRARADSRYLPAGAALLALTLGIRPQDALVPLGALALALMGRALSPRAGRRAKGLLAEPVGDASLDAQHDRRLTRPGVRDLGLALASALAVCIAWAIPLAIGSGGPAAAWRLMAGQSGYVGAADSLLARPLTWPNVAARLAEFGSVFSASAGGPRAGGLAAFLALAAAIALLAVFSPWTRLAALAWLLPYGAFMILFLRPDDPRKVLPVIPPLLLLLAGLRPKALGAALGLAAAAWFAVAARPLVVALDTVKAPPEQAAAYVASTYGPGDTLVLAGASYNAVRYRDPEFKTYLLDELDPAAVTRDLSSGTYRTLVILDKEGFTVPENYVGIETRTFQRDPLVLPKASTVWLAAYRPLDELRDRDLALPAGPVALGTPADVRYVMEGWYRPEIIAGTAARWTDQQARLRLWVDQPRDAVLRLAGVAYPPDQVLTVLVNGQPVASQPMPADWAPFTISVPAAVFQPAAINTITLQHRAARSAYDATQGQSLDRRPLAAAYSSFELTWQ